MVCFIVKFMYFEILTYYFHHKYFPLIYELDKKNYSILRFTCYDNINTFGHRIKYLGLLVFVFFWGGGCSKIHNWKDKKKISNLLFLFYEIQYNAMK